IVAVADVDWSLLDATLKGYQTDYSRIGTTMQGRSGAARSPTAAQQTANERRPAQNGGVNLKRFIDDQLPRLKRYKDYREMLDKQKDIDAIVVATPDHMHAAIATAAMEVGKHVYVQKPLCWSVEEARRLAQKAKATKVVTQMGNQGHSSDQARLGYEYI